MPIPTTLIQEKIVPVEKIIPMIQPVDKIREKIVPVVEQVSG
jgi:hypothetical protein